MTSLRKRIAFTAIVLALPFVVVAILEGSASIALFAHRAWRLRDADQSYIEGDTLLGWVNKANYSNNNLFAPGVSVHTNAQRFRHAGDVQPRVPDGVTRVVCSGDSFTLGYGVGDDESWCAQLGANNPALEMINMGQGGYGIDQAYLWYVRDGLKLQPRVHLFAFITLDFYRMMDNKLEGYPRPQLKLENGALHTIGVPLPGPGLGPYMKRLAGPIREFRTYSLFQRVAPNSSRGSDSAAGFSRDSSTFALVRAALNEMAQKDKAAGGQLVVVYLPVLDDFRRPASNRLRGWVQTAANLGEFEFVDLVEPFRSIRADSVPQLFIAPRTMTFQGAAGDYSVAGNAWVKNSSCTGCPRLRPLHVQKRRQRQRISRQILDTLADDFRRTRVWFRKQLVSSTVPPAARVVVPSAEKPYSGIQPVRPANHMVQLDSIRTIACFAVIVFHEMPFSGKPFLGELGAMGVTLFFALSGFLITGILLRARDDAERNGTRVGGVLRAFYARRFLRIFPLYYLVLLALVLLNVQTIRQTIGWHGLYLSNILAARDGQYNFPTHFWSLAVEEQFYLGWSAIALFAPRRWLKGIALGMVVTGLVSRFALIEVTARKVTATSVPSSCLDLLGIGCVLALLWHEGDQNTGALRERVGRILLPLGLLLIAMQSYLQYIDRGYVLRVTLWTLPCALIGFWVIDNAARGFKGWAGAFLEWKPMVYLGTISYGLYVYHIFVPLSLRGLGIPFPEERGLARLLVVSVLTVMISALSWHLYEKPLNDLKGRFPYVKMRRALP